MNIVVCGSTEFATDMVEIANQISKKGHETSYPEPVLKEEDFAREYSREKLLEMKPIWMQGHFKKIENSDAVFILNKKRKGFDGYIGSNTLMEMTIAHYLKKKIFIMNPIEDGQPHYEELVSIKPVILDGDLEKIK